MRNLDKEIITKPSARDMLTHMIDISRCVKGTTAVGILVQSGEYKEADVKRALSGLVDGGQVTELYPKGTPPEKQIPENAYYILSVR